MQLKTILLILIALGFFAGCQSPHPDTSSLELTFNRGAQLLAAGNPKSAIPFLSQTIASEPDGPEPVALLSLAFALDLQSEQAILQAQKVHRIDKEPPGWEVVAVGIAETVRHRPAEAIASFQRVIASSPPGSPLIPATRQWLALAQIIKGDDAGALATLDQLAKCPAMKSSALLWTFLIRARDGQVAQANDALAQCARDVAASFGRPSFDGNPDDQTLYDIGIAAIAVADGKYDNARQLFTQLQKRNPEAADSSIWLALLSAAQGRWPDARSALLNTCETGPLPTRGLANQLSTVICAMEDRPESMIQHMLAGQRMMGRDTSPAHVVNPPQPESVWFSDSLK